MSAKSSDNGAYEQLSECTIMLEEIYSPIGISIDKLFLSSGMELVSKTPEIRFAHTRKHPRTNSKKITQLDNCNVSVLT